jgi:uncharacterized protein (DUF58 family)
MNPGRIGLTNRGWALLAVSLALALGGFLFGIEELYPIAAAGVVLIVASRAWVASRRWDVRVVRHVRPARVPAGVPARVELAVVNHGHEVSPILAARDPFDGGRRWARFLVAPLDPAESRWAAYSLPTSRRGVFELGPLQLELSDPFGLTRVGTIGCPTSTLTVHPRVESIRSPAWPAEPDPDMRVPQPVVGRLGDEFYGLREYRIGDDLRRVHWLSTARTDQVMIREPENLLQGRLTVAADLRTGIQDATTLEATLSAAASVAMAGIRNRIHVRVVTTSGIDTGFGASAPHGSAILDLLAGAAPHPGTTLTDDLPFGASASGPLVLITTQAASDTDLSAATRASRRDRFTLVIFERSGSGARRPAPARIPANSRVVVVPHGGSFRSAWEGLPC